jgi:hypothetical protein
MATCTHPLCAGVHDNNRYAELCPRSIELKRARDRDYSRNHPDKIFEKHQRQASNARRRQLEELFGAEFAAAISSGNCVITRGREAA